MVCIGVGMYPGYGAAQRLYVKRGYVPDGSGLWYRDRPLAPMAPCANDDDLVLHLSKKLQRHQLRLLGRRSSPRSCSPGLTGSSRWSGAGGR